MSVFSVFTETNFTFEGERPDERVVTLLYRHWFILTVRLLGFVLVGLVPIGLYLVFSIFTIFSYFKELYLLLAGGFYLVLWFSTFYMITMYLLDTWVITNHRVIDSEQHGLFNRTVAELSLSKIQDVSTRVEGPLATWLKFGDLEIQTAGTSPKFSFKQIPDPIAVKDQLMRAHNTYMTEHPGGVETHDM